MVKYTIKMLQRASDDLDNIYNHIADDFKEIGTAEKMANIGSNLVKKRTDVLFCHL